MSTKIKQQDIRLTAFTTGGTDLNYMLNIERYASYEADQLFLIKFHATNQALATININGLGAKDLVAAAGELVVGTSYLMIYNGTEFSIISKSGGAMDCAGVKTCIEAFTDLNLSNLTTLTLGGNVTFALGTTIDWTNTTNSGTQVFLDNYVANYNGSIINYNDGLGGPTIVNYGGSTQVNYGINTEVNLGGTTNIENANITNINLIGGGVVSLTGAWEYEETLVGVTNYILVNTPISDKGFMVFVDSGTGLFPTTDYTYAPLTQTITFVPSLGATEKAVIWIMVGSTAAIVNVKPSHLDATNIPVDGQVPTKGTGVDQFTWEDKGGAGGITAYTIVASIMTGTTPVIVSNPQITATTPFNIYYASQPVGNITRTLGAGTITVVSDNPADIMNFTLVIFGFGNQTTYIRSATQTLNGTGPRIFNDGNITIDTPVNLFEYSQPAGYMTIEAGAGFVTIDSSGTEVNLDVDYIAFTQLSIGSILNGAYGPSWSGDISNAPSRDAMYNKIESMVSSFPGVSRTSGSFSRELMGQPNGTTVQTIAHGLGRIPKRVKFNFFYNSDVLGGGTFNGVLDDSGQQCCYPDNSTSQKYTLDISHAMRYRKGNDLNADQQCTVTVDVTNITLTWNVTSAASWSSSQPTNTIRQAE